MEDGYARGSVVEHKLLDVHRTQICLLCPQPLSIHQTRHQLCHVTKRRRRTHMVALQTRKWKKVGMR